jgi:ATP-dependent Clp protease adapter protein ClpS
LHNQIDKKWPHIFVDNKRDQNVITLPDPYNFDMYVQRVLKCKLDMDQAPPVAWAEKKDVALWKGFRNG